MLLHMSTHTSKYVSKHMYVYIHVCLHECPTEANTILSSSSAMLFWSLAITTGITHVSNMSHTHVDNTYGRPIGMGLPRRGLFGRGLFGRGLFGRELFG